MTVPVVWHTWNGGDGRACWDQDVVEWLTGRPVPGRPDYQHIYGGLDALDFDAHDGAIIVTPARFQVDHLDRINTDLARLRWVLLIATSDEESTFPYDKLDHPNLRVWCQTPRVDRHDPDRLRFMPLGWPTHGLDSIAQLPPDRPQDRSVVFHGQVNHRQRDEMLRAMGKVDRGNLGGSLIEASPGFTQGWPRDRYLAELARAKVAPAPAGPQTPDTFRCWEALECGAVPIVDRGPLPDPEGRAIADYPDGFWPLLLGDNPPFPVVDHWAQAVVLARRVIEQWPRSGNRVQAWWQSYKRNLACRLADDVAELSGRTNGTGLADLVTVLIPTSPIPSHPDTAIIEETVASVTERLPGAEIVLMIDGVRAEQEHRRRAYEEYTRRLLWLANHRWPSVLPLLFDAHHHQAAMTRKALEAVRTPLVLFVEHDTPLVGDVPWAKLADVVLSGAANVIRLAHEASVLEPHLHLFDPLGGVVEVGGVPLRRTIQWSQRPFLSATDWFRGMIGAHFPMTARTMIEDVLHGRVQDAWEQFGDEGWALWKLWLFHPPGDIKRSTHLDGRGDDEKFPMRFE